MQSTQGVRPSALIRDLILFHIKLVLDGLKDLVMIWLSVIAVVVDLFISPRHRRGRYFYAVMRMGERFELWLNLYAPARRAETNPDGLFGESRAGDSTFVGRMEELMRGQEASTPGRPGIRSI
jgi:hypothetical protein